MLSPWVGIAPVKWRCEKGSFEIVELLLTDQKVRIDVQDRKGFTPLHFAAARNDVRIAELLLREGNIRKIDLNAIKDNEGNSVLHIAAAWKADEVVFKLIGTNVDINERNNFGCTPLLLAVDNRSPNIAEFLLQNKACWSIPAYNGNTVLHLSVHHGLSKIVRLLLEEGCDPNTENNDGVMPMQMASLDWSDIIVDLLKHAAKSDVYDEAGWTIWHVATACKIEKIVDALLENCKEFVNIKSKSGATPLHLAAFFNAVEIATKLIEKGAEVDSLDANMETPLFYAAAGNSCTAAKLLLDLEDTKPSPRRKKRVQSNNPSKRTNTKGLHGRTPLHVAAISNAVRVARTLIDYGGDMNARDTSNMTPLHYAKYRNQEEFVTFLLEHPKTQELPLSRQLLPEKLALLPTVSTAPTILHPVENIVLRAINFNFTFQNPASFAYIAPENAYSVSLLRCSG